MKVARVSRHSTTINSNPFTLGRNLKGRVQDRNPLVVKWCTGTEMPRKPFYDGQAEAFVDIKTPSSSLLSGGFDLDLQDTFFIFPYHE